MWFERDAKGLSYQVVRRELLDHVVVLSEGHLRRLLREYVAYYNTERAHTSIGTRRKAELPKRGRRDQPGSPVYRVLAVFRADTRGARQRE